MIAGLGSPDGGTMRLDVRNGIPQMVVATLVLSLLWWSVFRFVPELSAMGEAIARLIVAIKCICIAVLLTFLTGIEAVSHERLLGNSFIPLAGHETQRLKVNLRYLQNTLEQIALFVPGLLGLSLYCADGSSMRAVIAATMVWIVARLAFWIGYHVGPQYRVAGLIGMAQSLIVLLYVSARIGYDVGGLVGASVPVTLFGIAELMVVLSVRRPEFLAEDTLTF